MSLTFSKPTLGFAAFSGTGKTTLLKQLIPLLTERGVRVALIKHAHHSFDIDHPGKDSYELRKAGAWQTLIASRKRWALMTERSDEREPRLGDLLGHIDADNTDLLLVEGFKHEAFPKIELHRAALRQPLLFLSDPNIIAVACDTELPQSSSLPILNINAPNDIAEFILNKVLHGAETT